MHVHGSARAAALILAAACGSPSPPPLPPGATPMPRVEGLRLDAARSDLARAGVGPDRVEVVGGGAFGVVDDSRWWVCDQEPDAGRAVGPPVRLLVDREGRCGRGDELAPAD